jgi:hypothetical protein
MEVIVKSSTFYEIGGALVVVALLFVAVGCSNSNPVIPQSNLDNNLVRTLAKDAPRDAQSAAFDLYGEVLAFYPDKYLMVFSAEDISNRSAEPVKYSLLVSKDAVIVLVSDRETVPFDAKYIPDGTTLSVSGTVENDGTMVVDRLEIGKILPQALSGSSAI